MKLTSKTIAVFASLMGLSQAAITISGTTGTSFKGSDGLTNIPSGSLYMVVADTGSAGFLADNGSLNAAISNTVNGLTTSSDPDVLAANASITALGTFGGDTILATGSVSTAGVIGGLLSSVTVADYLNKNFALIWFSKSAATLTTEGLAGQYYGIMKLSDWTLPAADSGTFTLNPTDNGVATTYYSVSSTITSAQIGASNGFFTGTGTAGDGTADVKAATFQIIPEPSAALLGAIGALGLLRRRRN